MKVALSALPSFTALPGVGDHLTAGIIIGPSLPYMDRAWLDARTFGWSRRPVVEVLIPSTLDDTLCPPGRHVASLFCQHVAPQLPVGRSWDDHREEVADLMIATVDQYAPGFALSVIGRQFCRRSILNASSACWAGHFPRRPDAEPVVLGAADAGTCRLPRPAAGSLSLRLRRPSRRRRHRRPRPQRRPRHPAGSSGTVRLTRRPDVNPAQPVDRLWINCR